MKIELHKFEGHRQIDLVGYCEDSKELVVKFGNGVGNDNVYECSNYIATPQIEKEKEVQK